MEIAVEAGENDRIIVIPAQKWRRLCDELPMWAVEVLESAVEVVE